MALGVGLGRTEGVDVGVGVMAWAYAPVTEPNEAAAASPPPSRSAHRRDMRLRRFSGKGITQVYACDAPLPKNAASAETGTFTGET